MTKCRNCPGEAKSGRKRCEKCLAREREYARSRLDKVRNHTLKRDFGITLEEYKEMEEAQDGRCAICRQPETKTHPSGKIFSLAVDHNHATGEVRALLCGLCNTGPGNFKDDPALLGAAIQYLTDFGFSI